MPSLKTYDLFISHAWKYGDEYERLIALLDSAPNFSYRNYSAPSEKPLHNLDSTDVTKKSQIKAAIDRKIAPVNCVLVISGMYTSYSDWMQYELDTAFIASRPIVAIKPWGNTNMPSAVTAVANIVVNWDTASIVAAIRNYSL